MALEEQSLAELIDFEQALQDGVVIPDDDVRAAAQVVDALMKAIKAFRYYEPQHPQLEQFRRELLSRFQRYFSLHPVLTLGVSELAFLVEGQPVCTAHNLHGSVPFLFYRDGVRLLRFHDSLDADELLGFVQCVAQSDHANQLEDDLVTLLWEQEFSAIDVQAADYLPSDLPIAVPETLEQFREALSATMDGQPSPALEPDTPEFFQPELPHFTAPEAGYFRLTTEEVLALRQEVMAVVSPARAFGYVDLLFDLLALEDDPALFTEVARVMQETLEALLISGNLLQAVDVLDRLTGFAQLLTPGSWKRPPLAQVPASVTTIGGIALIIRPLQAGDVSEDVARRLLRALPPAATPALARVLGDLTDGRLRALLRDVLAERCRESVAPLTPFLEDPRETLVCDVARVLGTVGDVSSVSMLARIFAARGPAVRKAAVEAVAPMRDPGAEALLIRALRDGQAEIRARAAVLLGQRQSAAALDALLNVVSEKRFYLRSPAEVRAFLIGVGRVGTNGALAVLEELVLQKPWFGKKKADAIRAHAAHALALIGTPEALALLEAGAASEDEQIRAACRHAQKSAGKGAPPQ